MKVAIEGGEAWTYSYDNKNELVKAQLWESDPAEYGTGDTLLEEVDYKYDAWGNLVERDLYPTGSGTPTVTRYAVDGWNPALAGATGNANFNVWADLDGSNDLLTRYLHGNQVDQLFARQDASVQYWYLTDYQGSVRDVLDNSGNVKDAIVYDGFGNIISETNSAYRGQYAWTGRMFNVETDLQYNRARWYDPSTGRWQSQDPLGFDAGDSNLYRYVNNAPANDADPSGDIGIFFDGAGQNEKTNSGIKQLYDKYDGEKVYIPIGVTFDATKGLDHFNQNIDKGIKAILDAYLKAVKDKTTEPIDVFGWSRGAIEAVGLTQFLTALEAELEKQLPGITKKYPLRIRFIGLIDPVATGVINAPSEIKKNTGCVWIGTRDGNQDLLDRTIFKQVEVKVEDGKLTVVSIKKYTTSHAGSGYNKAIIKDLYEAAKEKGVKFTGPP